MDWRRIAKLQFWLLFFPPFGWWMLWNETSLSSIAKIRILFYTYLIPLVIYMILLIYVFNAADRALQGVGGGF